MTKTTLKLSSEIKLRILVNLLIVYFYPIVSFLMSYFLTKQNLKTSLFYCSIVLLAVLFASLAEHTINPIMFHIFMFISFFVLFFTFGFRQFSAIDDSTYIAIFELTSNLGWFEYFKYSTMEPGYLVLNKIISSFTDNYLYMQLTTSFIPLFLFYYGFKKYKEMISLPTAVFLLCSMIYFQMLAVGLVRMFIAMGIVFIALRYIPKRRPFKYLLLILIATTFHYSSFFMIFLAYFAINKSNLSKKATKSYIIISILCPLIFIGVGKLIVPLLGSRYQQYGQIESLSFSFSTFSTVPLIILLFLFYKKFKDEEQLYFKLFMFIFALSIVISLSAGLIGLGRLIFYSYVAFILGASMISKKIKFNSSKIIFSFIIIFYGFLYVFYSQFANELHISNLSPYKNIFFLF